jgi:hypothetical protein
MSDNSGFDKKTIDENLPHKTKLVLVPKAVTPYPLF